MSGSGWVITSMWISGSLPFLYSSMYSYHFLIYSASVKSTLFLSFIVPIIVWHVPLVSLIFSKRSLVLPIPLFSLFICIVCSRRFSYLSLLFFGTLHSDGYSFPFLLAFCFSSLLFFFLIYILCPLVNSFSCSLSHPLLFHLIRKIFKEDWLDKWE